MENQQTIGPGAALRNRMNFLIARQGMIASNIANASTPGYVAKDVQFSQAVSRASMAMATTNEGHIQMGVRNAQFQQFERPAQLKNNGNAVDPSVELQNIAEVQLEHRMMTNLIGKYASMQRLALGRQQ